MEFQRNILLFAWLFVTFLIWTEWKKDHAYSSKLQESENKSSIFEEEHEIKKRFVTVETDVFRVYLSSDEGNVLKVELLKYKTDLNSNKPFCLLNTEKNFLYQIQSGIISIDGPDNLKNNNIIKPKYKTKLKNYYLNNGDTNLVIRFYFLDKNNVLYKKIYTFKPNRYDIDLDFLIENNSKKNLYINFFGQLKQTKDFIKNNNVNKNDFSLNSYRGLALSSDKNNYKKYSFSDIEKGDLSIYSNGGWIAMLQQYFTTAWIPSKYERNFFYTKNLNNKIAIIGCKSDEKKILPNGTYKYSSKIWIGPSLQSEMKKIAKNLDLSVDYGWLWFISQPLFKLLKFIYRFVGNWGFSIIIITFLVRCVMYPLTKTQYISIAKMKILGPKINEIKENNYHDKQKMSREIMALYHSENVNPLGGCLPLIIQMPIFLALYYMLIRSVELRHAHFIYWIKDLSDKDPYYVLPFFMGVTMYIIQKISPSASTDPVQNKILTYMPIIFTIFFFWFPSGLVLYYIVSNCVTIVQQKIIYRRIKKI
ncbi:insertase [Candidatus Riesia sp. GBBU]|nr:insertase [Candidatus Riesia sp. GBBU]